MDFADIPKPEGEVVIEKGITVPMRDGVKLAAYLYHPPGEGPWPVIVNRLPYGSSQAESFAKYFAGKGYAFLIQDTRGRYNSEGGSEKFYPFITEEADGRDTLEWVKKQPWCNSKIGTWGGSYHGYTQWAPAASNPNLDAMAPLLTTTDLYRFHYIGGAFRLEMWLNWGCKNLYRKNKLFAGNPGEGLRHLPIIKADDVARDDWPWWNDVVTHPTRDEFWRPLDFSGRIDRVAAPALMISGWYDLFNTDQLRDFEKWQERGAAAPPAKIIVGPWNHVFYNPHLKNVEWGWKDAAQLILKPCRMWFDRWLKGKRNGVEESPPVKIYVMGEGKWREFDMWPPMGIKMLSLYLHSSGGANTSSGDGTLTVDPPSSEEPPDKFDYDPLNPVPTKGGPGLMPWGAGPADQGKIEERADVLVYSTEPLEEPLTAIGPVTVKLSAATSAPDTDFTAKLVDVHPDGKAIIILEGILRGRYRQGGTAKMLTPEKIYEWNIDLGYTALRFKPGHRIRLEVSSSNFPRFDRNLNTGENQATGTRTEIAHQKVYHSKPYPSRLMLNIVKD